MALKKIITSNNEIKWELRFHENGRGTKRIRRIFDRKADAENFLLEFRRESKVKFSSPFALSTFEGKTFRAEACLWQNDGFHRFSASYFKKVSGILKELDPIIGDYEVSRLTSEVVTQVQKKLIKLSEEKYKDLNKKPTNTAINRKTEVIMAVLNYSSRQKRIPMNPAIGFKALPKVRTEMKFWNKREAQSFLQKMNETYPKGHMRRWIYVAYLLALNTALRAGEIWGIRVKDIGEDGKVIFVRRQFNRLTREFTQMKAGGTRVVPCTPELFRELESLILSKKLKGDDLIFTNDEGKPISHDNFTDRTFTKDLKTWEGRKIRFHDLRHTAATLMLASGVDIKTVQSICGHANITTTMNYAHLVGGSVERVSKIFSLGVDLPQRDLSKNSLRNFEKV